MLFLSPIVVLIAFTGNILATSVPTQRSVVPSISSISARDSDPDYVKVAPLPVMANKKGLAFLKIAKNKGIIPYLKSTIADLIISVAQQVNESDSDLTYVQTAESLPVGSNKTDTQIMLGVVVTPEAEAEASLKKFSDLIIAEMLNSNVSVTAEEFATKIVHFMSSANAYIAGACVVPYSINESAPLGKGVVAFVNTNSAVSTDLSKIAPLCI